jgi:hypothetical protein
LVLRCPHGLDLTQYACLDCDDEDARRDDDYMAYLIAKENDDEDEIQRIFIDRDY